VSSACREVMRLLSIIAALLLFYVVILGSVWTVAGAELRVVKPLVPLGCFSPPPPYGCHGGSFKSLWHQHTHDMQIIERLGIAEGDCLYCHSRERLQELFEEHPFKFWRWHEKAEELKQQPKQLWALPQFSSIALLSLVGWGLVIGTAWIALRGKG